MNLLEAKQIKWTEKLETDILIGNTKLNDIGSAYISEDQKYLFILKITNSEYLISIYPFENNKIEANNALFVLEENDLDKISLRAEEILKFEPFMMLNDRHTR